MSGGGRSVAAVNPWHRLRELAHVELLWHDGGPMGLSDFVASTISLRRGMTWAERRCTVLHEVIHHERGPFLDTHELHEEEQVRRQTAREMLPDIRAIGEALAWAHTNAEAADELGVDEDTLRTRLLRLHPAERHYLQRRLAEV